MFLELSEAPPRHGSRLSKVASPVSLQVVPVFVWLTGPSPSSRVWISGLRKARAFLFRPPRFKDVLRAAS